MVEKKSGVADQSDSTPSGFTPEQLTQLRDIVAEMVKPAGGSSVPAAKPVVPSVKEENAGGGSVDYGKIIEGVVDGLNKQAAVDMPTPRNVSGGTKDVDDESWARNYVNRYRVRNNLKPFDFELERVMDMAEWRQYNVEHNRQRGA